MDIKAVRDKIRHAIDTGRFQFEMKQKAAKQRDDLEAAEKTEAQHRWMKRLIERLHLLVQMAEGEGRRYINIASTEIPYGLTARSVAQLYQYPPYFVHGVKMQAVHADAQHENADLEITWDVLREMKTE